MNDPLVDVTGARRRRERARRKRQLTLLGAVAAVALLIGGGVWVVFGSGWLAVSEVSVSGTKILTPAQVIEAAEVPLGVPLARVDTDAAARRVLERLPAAEAAAVGRAWPRTLTIHIQETRPRVALEVPGSFVWIAQDGRSFHTTPDRPHGVLLARGRVEDEGVLATVASVAAALPPAVVGQADAIEASSVDSVVVVLADGRRIVWGSAEHAELKAAVLEPLLTVEAQEYDVSAPTHPTTR
ncbi:MAG: FtsQ-type POTRA domain-containing protein [Propionibacteriaceae bacterium]|nr:FtsQ-type POTRA domain-containing protein [Propionibacteriaceae bacterium]